VSTAHKFAGAGLVEQQSEGHCSISTVSACTIQKVRAYLYEGKIPNPPVWGPEGKEIEKGQWETCERSEWPWKPFIKHEWMREQVQQRGHGNYEEQIMVEGSGASENMERGSNRRRTHFELRKGWPGRIEIVGTLKEGLIGMFERYELCVMYCL